MSAHRSNQNLHALAVSEEFTIDDPGNGGVFEVGERLFAYCDISPAGGGETRELPTVAVPTGTQLFLRNQDDTNSVSLTIGSVSVTIAANTGVLCYKINTGGGLSRHWLTSEFVGGS